MIILEGKYKVESKLGEGSFGKIYKGHNANTGKRVAIKMESVHGRQLLLNEARMYVALQKCRGVSMLRAFGTYGEFNYIVVDLFERDLEDIVSGTIEMFSAAQIFNWGHHILRILQTVHEVGILHRDIKPENVMVRGEKLFLIDLGISRFFRSHSGEHNPANTGKALVGTMRYASAHNHDGVSTSRRDDLESVAYTLLFLYHKDLPWFDANDHTSVEQRGLVRELKTMERIREWCAKEGTPPRLVEFIEYSKSLAFDAAPEYTFFDDFQDLKDGAYRGLICQSRESSDKSSGSTTSRDTDSSPS